MWKPLARRLLAFLDRHAVAGSAAIVGWIAVSAWIASSYAPAIFTEVKLLGIGLELAGALLAYFLARRFLE